MFGRTLSFHFTVKVNSLVGRNPELRNETRKAVRFFCAQFYE